MENEVFLVYALRAEDDSPWLSAIFYNRADADTRVERFTRKGHMAWVRIEEVL